MYNSDAYNKYPPPQTQSHHHPPPDSHHHPPPDSHHYPPPDGHEYPPPQSHQASESQKYCYYAQIAMRSLAVAASAAAAAVMINNKQRVLVGGTVPMYARYDYAPAFKFFAVANAVAGVFSLLSLLYLLFAEANYFFLFLSDLVAMSVEMAACAAATTVGFIGKYGYPRVMWIPICSRFGLFCKKVTTSLGIAYFSFIVLMALTIMSANRSRKTHYY